MATAESKITPELQARADSIGEDLVDVVVELGGSAVAETAAASASAEASRRLRREG